MRPQVPNDIKAKSPSRRLNRKQAAEYLAVSVSWLDKARLSGLGPAFIAISSRVLYDSGDLDEFIERNRRTSTSKRADDTRCKTLQRIPSPVAAVRKPSPRRETHYKRTVFLIFGFYHTVHPKDSASYHSSSQQEQSHERFQSRLPHLRQSKSA